MKVKDRMRETVRMKGEDEGECVDEDGRTSIRMRERVSTRSKVASGQI